jgi:hypothetical protein
VYRMCANRFGNFDEFVMSSDRKPRRTLCRQSPLQTRLLTSAHATASQRRPAPAINSTALARGSELPPFLNYPNQQDRSPFRAGVPFFGAGK